MGPGTVISGFSFKEFLSAVTGENWGGVSCKRLLRVFRFVFFCFFH